MPTARASLAAAALFDGTVVALGGRTNDSRASAAVEAYHPDVDQWEKQQPLAVAREGLCAGILEGVLYAAGGFNGTTYLAVLEAWNGTAWRTLAPMTYARSGAACAIVNDVFIVYGGRNERGVLRNVEAYVPKTILDCSWRRSRRPVWRRWCWWRV